MAVMEGNNDRAAGLGIPEHHRERDADSNRSRSRWVALVASKEGEVMSELDEQQQLIIQLEAALYDALAYIEEVARDFGVVPEEDVLKRITAALEAAKGE